MIVSTHNGEIAVLDDREDPEDQDIDYGSAADDIYLAHVADVAKGERSRELEFCSHY